MIAASVLGKLDFIGKSLPEIVGTLKKEGYDVNYYIEDGNFVLSILQTIIIPIEELADEPGPEESNTLPGPDATGTVTGRWKSSSGDTDPQGGRYTGLSRQPGTDEVGEVSEGSNGEGG
jgi:hypothetical protein|tara:strand:- start:524 stop:880 length:357 start_codon:yes stop_codon:yes gene_type:complete